MSGTNGNGTGRPPVIDAACKYFFENDHERAWRALCNHELGAPAALVERWIDELARCAGIPPTEFLHLFGERRHDPAYSEPPATPKPLGVSEVPRFPVGVLPPVLRRYVTEAAAAFQVEPDVVAFCVFAVLAIAAAHRAHVLLRPDWSEQLNLALQLVLESGEKKSPVLKAAKEPLEHIQRLERQRMAPLIARAAARKRTLELAADRAARDFAAGKGSQEAAELAAVERDSFEIPPTPLVLADNTTPEKLVSDICEQGGKLGVISDEGGFIANALGRYSADGAMGDPIEDVLKAISNDSLSNRRRTPGRDCSHPLPALTVLAVIQPVVLEGVRARPGTIDRGFLPRFDFTLPRSRAGSRRVYDVPELSERARQDYADAVRAIYDLPIRPDEFGYPDSPAIKLTPEALAVLLEHAESVERRLVPGGELVPIKAWASKEPGRIARWAALLHLADNGAEALEVPLGEAAAKAAVVIGHYLEQHAFAAFGLTAGHELDGAAVYLLRRWIDAGKRPASTKKLFDLARALGSAAKVRAVLVHLRDEHALVDGPHHVEREGRGRRASPLWTLHPDAAEFCVKCVFGADRALDPSSSSLSENSLKGANYAESAELREPDSEGAFS